MEFDDRGEVSQEWAEPGEINRIGIWPNNPVSEDSLAVVLVHVNVAAAIEGLSAYQSPLNRVIEEIFDS